MTGTHDIAINGGEVIDGTKSAKRRASLGIDHGVITEVKAERLAGAVKINASGLIVAPGLIDLHSHADFTLTQAPTAVTQLAQGVTTVLTGNCGMSPFPASPDGLDEPAASTKSGAAERFAEDAVSFMSDLGRCSTLGLNVATQVGLGAVRSAVLGADRRPPTAVERSAMRGHVLDALSSGAFGLSSGLIYAPDRFADEGEIDALLSVVARRHALYSTHMRDEAGGLVQSVAEAISAAQNASVRLEISHLKDMGVGKKQRVEQALELILAARRSDTDVGFDAYPYSATSTALSSRLPDWLLAGGVSALPARLANRSTRSRACSDLSARLQYDFAAENVVLASVSDVHYGRYLGSSFQEIAQAEAGRPVDCMIDVLRKDPHAGVINHALSQNDVDTIITHPLCAIASDSITMTPTGVGQPHPRNFGTFARVFRDYVRDRGLLSMEEAVFKMTALPASRLNLERRGRIAPGMLADVVVFDPHEITDRSTYLEPWQLASGVAAVLVNGVPTMLDGRFTGQWAGRILRSGPRGHLQSRAG